ncbi:MAG: tetratricopeptide repeat protein [Thermoanaerobaculia bacterium]|nr:tetratricopeptide repeat protein [Thermoanaerobaculia bacterium]
MSAARRRADAKYALALLIPALVGCHSAVPSSDLDLHRGRNALAMARYDWARHYFAADLANHPDRLESLRGLGLGWISGHQGSLTRAIEAFEVYLARVPDDVEIRLRLAEGYLRTADHKQALDTLARLPESLDTHLLFARIYSPEDPKLALVHVGKAIELDPDHAAARHLAAQLYSRLGDSERALAEAERAAELDPLRRDVFYLISQLRRRMGRLDEVQAAVDRFQLLDQLPKPGAMTMSNRELDILRQVEEQLLVSSPITFERRMVRLLLQTGAVREASERLEKVVSDPACDADCLLLLGQAAHTRNLTSIARDLYGRVLDQHPNHTKALAHQARLAFEFGDLEATQELLTRGFEVDAMYAPFHYTAGLLALAEEDPERAAQELSLAVDLVPWLARYRLTLADLLLTDGDRAAFDRLLAAAPAGDSSIDAYRRKHGL